MAVAAGDASASHPHWAPALGDLAENEDFWGNVAAYGRYFVSVMLGTAYIMTKPFAEALKRPKTAVLVVLGTGALFWFLSASVKLMLGIDEGWPWVVGFGTTFFLLTRVALTVTDEDVKNSKMTNPRGAHD